MNEILALLYRKRARLKRAAHKAHETFMAAQKDAKATLHAWEDLHMRVAFHDRAIALLEEASERDIAPDVAPLTDAGVRPSATVISFVGGWPFGTRKVLTKN